MDSKLKTEYPTESLIINGPSVIGHDWKRFWNLTWTLAAMEYKLTYFGSVLGYLWTLMRPLMLFGVLYVVFSQILAIGSEIQDYALILLMNIMLWTFFTDVAGSAVSSIVDRETLVRKVHYPLLAIPFSVTLTGLFNLAANLVAVFIFIMAFGIAPKVEWLLFPLILIPFIVFSTGVALILSSLFVRYRDVRPIWSVVQTALFYATPILYVVDIIPDRFKQLIMSSPIAATLEQVRKAVIDPSAPSAVEAVGGPIPFLVPVCIVVVSVWFGLWYFIRETPNVAEDL